MKNSEPTARKKNKATDPDCGQVVIIESTKKGCYSDLAIKVKPNKKKCLVKGMGSELLGPKKKKKQSNSESKKKARARSPVIIENNSDSELLRGTRKRLKVFKKKKDRKLSYKQVHYEALGEGQPGADFHVNKKCNRNILKVEEQVEELMMKRKKKTKEKRKYKPICSLILHSGDSEESAKQISGKQKADCQEMLFSSQKKRRTLGQKAVGDGVLVKKKHRDYHVGNQENSNGISKEGTANSVSKLQDAQSWDGHIQWQEDLVCSSEKRSKAIKKKKQLKKANTGSLSSLAKNHENYGSVKCQSKTGLGVGKAPKEVNKPAKKKRKKKREAGDVSHFSEDGQDILSEVAAPGGKEKRKKAKKAKMEQDYIVRNDQFEDSQEQQIKKKRKNRETGSSRDSNREASWKQAKARKESKETEDEIKLVAFRKGNCDEVNIDKVRRQALQEEIDRESGKTKIVREEPDNRFGQWSTATFETSEKKATFLRLMGGFKKGTASSHTSPANTIKPNMALDWSREQELQHNLQAEFEKAIAFKHHRGVGLGFQPTAPSCVHTDKYASKSIKFED
ncbi:lysine-rich nucleolar protein 1 isoform 1-T2 [Liasis olivaceus]